MEGGREKDSGRGQRGENQKQTDRERQIETGHACVCCPARWFPTWVWAPTMIRSFIHHTGSETVIEGQVLRLLRQTQENFYCSVL